MLDLMNAPEMGEDIEEVPYLPRHHHRYARQRMPWRNNQILAALLYQRLGWVGRPFTCSR